MDFRFVFPGNEKLPSNEESQILYLFLAYWHVIVNRKGKGTGRKSSPPKTND